MRKFLIFIFVNASALQAGVGYWSWIGPLQGNVSAMYIDSLYLYIAFENNGIFRYDISTGLWDTLNTPGDSVRAILVYPDHYKMLIGLQVHQGHSMWKSMDGGYTWFPSDSGLTAPGLADVLPVSDIKGEINSPDTVFITTLDGVWMSPDFGESWIYVFSDDPSLYFNARTLTVATPETLYAGGQNFVFEGQIYRSVDGGNSWEFLWGTYSAGGEGPLTGITQHPYNPYLIMASVGGYFVPGIYRSTNGGVSFNATFSQWTNSVRFHPVDSSIAYAGTNELGFLKSDNAGVSWYYMNDSLPVTQINDFVIAYDHRTIFAGTPMGVYEYTEPEVFVEEGMTSRGLPGVRVFPNPVSRTLNFQFNDRTTALVRVINTAGQTIYREKFNNTSLAKIDFSDISSNSGVFLVQVISNSARETFPVVFLK